MPLFLKMWFFYCVNCMSWKLYHSKVENTVSSTFTELFSIRKFQVLGPQVQFQGSTSHRGNQAMTEIELLPLGLRVLIVSSFSPAENLN